MLNLEGDLVTNYNKLFNLKFFQAKTNTKYKYILKINKYDLLTDLSTIRAI